MPQVSTSANHKPNLLTRFILWREKHISERIFLLILSFVVGILSSLAGFLLKGAIELIQEALMTDFRHSNYLYLLLPPVGILITYLIVRYIVKDDIGHGVTKILFALSQRKSRIKPHNTWSSLVSSAITIGFGGSVGAESPIVLTGSAIGSNIGRTFRLDQRHLMLLVGCGAAGAIGGIFKAPITGLVFVIEVLLMDLTLGSVLPLLLASVTSAALSYILTGQRSLFSFYQNDPFITERIPYVLLLGITCGFVSLYFSRTMFFIETRLKKISRYPVKFAVSALILSVLIFIFPPLYGEGYSTLETLMSGQYDLLLKGSLFQGEAGSYWFLFLFMLAAMLVKVFASVATNSGGGCGGLFAPSLFVGGLCGFLFAYALNYFPFVSDFLPNKNFVLMGMAGVMAGVMHAPLTGTFLIAELTGGYDLLLPLLLVSISSYGTIRLFMPHSIYSLRLAQKGELITHDKDKAVLTVMTLESVIEKDFDVVSPGMTLGEMVQVIGRAKRNLFPVVGEDGRLLGIVLMDNIRNIMFRPELYNRFTVQKFMVEPPFILTSDMSMESIMGKFDETGAWNLPVVDSAGRYEGFVSKSKIFNTYREVLNVITPED